MNACNELKGLGRMCGLMVAMVLTATLSSAQLPSLPSGCPGYQLHGAMKGAAVWELPNARGEATYDTLGKRIDVLYTAPVVDCFVNVTNSAHTYFSVSYWPTDVTVLSPGRWIVSGKSTRNADAVIEEWEFENGGAVVPHPNGQQWALSARSSVKELYRGHDYGLVEKVFPVLGADVSAITDPNASVFVLFNPSHDLYRMRLDTAALVLAASPVAVSPPTSPAYHVVSQLADRWDSFWCGTHTTHGNVYVFKKWGAGFGLEGPVLVIVDAAKTGVLNSHQLLTPNQWTGGLWWDADNYTLFR